MLHAETSKAALKAWLKARGDAVFPLASNFGPFEMKPFLPYTAMFRKMDDGVIRITLVGTALVEGFGGDATGQEVKSIYPPAEHDLLNQFYDLIFPNHYLSQSLRSFRHVNGVETLIEQFLLPVGNNEGVHDRYMLVVNELPMPDPAVSEPRTELLISDLQRRTIYDPQTLMPVDCPLTTPRSVEEMATSLLDPGLVPEIEEQVR